MTWTTHKFRAAQAAHREAIRQKAMTDGEPWAGLHAAQVAGDIANDELDLAIARSAFGDIEGIRSVVERVAEPWARDHVAPTFAGDADAAQRLAFALGNSKRGRIALLMWKARVPGPAFRAFLRPVWDHDFGWLLGAAKTRTRIAGMFEHAAFPTPDSLPALVRVWRGTSGISAPRARRGYSWTTDRDVACWFATVYGGTRAPALVLRADIPREAIALFTDERNEAECVLLSGAPDAAIDGVMDDWRHRGEVASERKVAARAGLAQVAR